MTDGKRRAASFWEKNLCGVAVGRGWGYALAIVFDGREQAWTRGKSCCFAVENCQKLYKVYYH
ncbi:MAG: hypothetical protein RR387_04935 [Clostridiales bacterium]